MSVKTRVMMADDETRLLQTLKKETCELPNRKRSALVSVVLLLGPFSLSG